MRDRQMRDRRLRRALDRRARPRRRWPTPRDRVKPAVSGAAGPERRHDAGGSRRAAMRRCARRDEGGDGRTDRDRGGPREPAEDALSARVARRAGPGLRAPDPYPEREPSSLSLRCSSDRRLPFLLVATRRGLRHSPERGIGRRRARLDACTRSPRIPAARIPRRGEADAQPPGGSTSRRAVPDALTVACVRVAGRGDQVSWATIAVTMPNMPVSRSTWLRMWQCHTQVPGLSMCISTL